MSDSSPWDEPAPEFREVPKINPKTNEPPKMFFCSLCGSVVVNRKRHMKWHAEQQWKWN